MKIEVDVLPEEAVQIIEDLEKNKLLPETCVFLNKVIKKCKEKCIFLENEVSCFQEMGI